MSGAMGNDVMGIVSKLLGLSALDAAKEDIRAASKSVDEIIELLSIIRIEVWQIEPETKLLDEFEGPRDQYWKSTGKFEEGAVYEVREYVRPPRRSRFDGIAKKLRPV